MQPVRIHGGKKKKGRSRVSGGNGGVSREGASIAGKKKASVMISQQKKKGKPGPRKKDGWRWGFREQDSKAQPLFPGGKQKKGRGPSKLEGE